MAYIYCSDELHRRVKIKAAEEGLSMSDLLEKLIGSKSPAPAEMDERQEIAAALLDAWESGDRHVKAMLQGLIESYQERKQESQHESSKPQTSRARRRASR